MEIKISIDCPLCNQTITKDILFSNSMITEDEEIEVNIFHFERTYWECSKCKKKFTIGDVEIQNVDDI